MVYTNTSVLSIGYHTANKLTLPHIWHIREYGNLDFQINYFPSLAYTKMLMRNSRTAIFTTKALADHWYGSNDTNSKIVYNGFDNIGNDIQVNKPNKHLIKIGLVGYFLKGKGQLESLQIIKNLVREGIHVHLYFYGEFNVTSLYYKEVIKEINDHNLSGNVFFCGYKPQDEIYRNISFLLCCAKFEAFGRTLIEAMSYGIPVISKNSGGPQEIITHMEDGYLYNTLEEASAYLINCIESDFQYNFISNNAKKKVMNMFGNEKYINNMNEIFTDA